MSMLYMGDYMGKKKHMCPHRTKCSVNQEHSSDCSLPVHSTFTTWGKLLLIFGKIFASIRITEFLKLKKPSVTLRVWWNSIYTHIVPWKTRSNKFYKIKYVHSIYKTHRHMEVLWNKWQLCALWRRKCRWMESFIVIIAFTITASNADMTLAIQYFTLGILSVTLQR